MPGLEDMKSDLAPGKITETTPDGRHEQSPFTKSSNDSLGGDASVRLLKDRSREYLSQIREVAAGA